MLWMPTDPDIGHPRNSIQPALWNTLPTPPFWGHFPLLLYGLPILLSTVFHMNPIPPNGFKFHLLRAMQINTLTLSEKILLYSQLSQMHLLGISKKVCVFKFGGIE